MAACSEGLQGALLAGLWGSLLLVAVALMLVARAGPRVATSLLLLLTFGQVLCSVFSPHWLRPDDWLLPGVFNTVAAVLTSPSTLTLLDCAGWRYERMFVLAVTQPLQMLATFGMIFVPCYCYKYTKKGEGSEWSMGNFYLYFQGYYIYLHVVYMMVIATCLQPFTCQAYTYRGDAMLQGSLEAACTAHDPSRQSALRLMQAVGLILLFLVGVGVPAASALYFFIPSMRRRLQEHSRLPENYIEHQAGYYLVRDQHWSRFTMCRQFKPGSAKAKVHRKVLSRGSGQPLSVSFERFWLSVEMIWKLSLLILPLAVSDEEKSLKYLPGAVATFVMLVLQSMMQPYMSKPQNYAATGVYVSILMIYIEAMVFHRVDSSASAQDVVRIVAAVTAGGTGVLLLLNFLKEMFVWQRSYGDDKEAHRLEDTFKAELKEIFHASGAQKLDQKGNDKIYDAEELVDLEMAKQLHGAFETYKVCYSQIVAELRDDMAMADRSMGEIPPEPLMETESWRRVASLAEMKKMLPTQSSGAFDSAMAEKLAVAVEVVDANRVEQETKLLELRAPATAAGAAGDSSERRSMLAKQEGELHRTEEHLGAGMGEWSRQVGGWIDINVAEWLASYVLAELKAEKLSSGGYKYKSLHSADHRQGDLIDRKFSEYLKSKTSIYVIALQSGCRSGC